MPVTHKSMLLLKHKSSKTYFHTVSPQTFPNIRVMCHVLPNDEFTETVYHQYPITVV